MIRRPVCDKSDFDSMRNSLRESSQIEYEHIAEYIVESNEENSLEIQETELDSGIPQVTKDKELCKHTKHAQKFLVTPNNRMGLIHVTPTKLEVYIENCTNPIIIDKGAGFFIVEKE
ncbi:hypothetical protein O181_002623 [Austropuccinia psidii MF-1]|uniref:Uncharacterized protein n=1 Tax=Austropuccinia psidii MF-1 TaxID=1389203 RepID=A0A9Q3GCT3_9BASI|nr:hypothetical protein [Austropuccinia psidii MF-1]